jgi:long-chain acyl-CoA synthetase
MEYHGYWYFTNGAQNVPIYPTITEDDYEYILNHQEQYIVLYLMQKYFKSKFNKDKVPYLKEVFSFNPIEGCKTGRNYFSLAKTTAIKLMLKLAKA